MGRIAAILAGSSLLELSMVVRLALAPCIGLVDSGASHCFIAEHVARAAGVSWDTGISLMFAIPGKPRQSRVKHRIDLVNPTKPPSKHLCYHMSQLKPDELRKQLDSMPEKL